MAPISHSRFSFDRMFINAYDFKSFDTMSLPTVCACALCTVHTRESGLNNILICQIRMRYSFYTGMYVNVHLFSVGKLSTFKCLICYGIPYEIVFSFPHMTLIMLLCAEVAKKSITQNISNSDSAISVFCRDIHEIHEFD